MCFPQNFVYADSEIVQLAIALPEEGSRESTRNRDGVMHATELHPRSCQGNVLLQQDLFVCSNLWPLNCSSGGSDLYCSKCKLLVKRLASLSYSSKIAQN